MTANSKARNHPVHGGSQGAGGANPKVDPDVQDNRIKDPEDWVTGHEPMTGAQASYLKTLAEQTREPEAFEPDLDKAEASKRIDRLKEDRSR